MTKTQRLTVVLSGLNLALLAVQLAKGSPTLAQTDHPVLRGRGLEIVDAAGRVRAQFSVEPDGEAVFRMRDASGTIRVKLGAGEGGSGLVLLDETTEPAVHIVARRVATPAGAATTSIRVTGADGRHRVIKP